MILLFLAVELNAARNTENIPSRPLTNAFLKAHINSWRI